MTFYLPQLKRQSNNVSFLCKMFDASTVLKEFGVIGTNGQFFKLISDYNRNILINLTVNEVKQHFSMSILKNRKVLPMLYWIPKIHISSIGTRFIIGNNVLLNL